MATKRRPARGHRLLSVWRSGSVLGPRCWFLALNSQTVRNSLEKVLDAQEHSDTLTPSKIKNLETGKGNSTVLFNFSKNVRGHWARLVLKQRHILPKSNADNPNAKWFSYQRVLLGGCRVYSLLNHSQLHKYTHRLHAVSALVWDWHTYTFTGVLKRIISLLAATNETSTAVASTAVGAEATFLFG